MDVQSAISVEGLIYTYPGQAKPAIDNVCFNIREGEIFGLLGPSGAGSRMSWWFVGLGYLLLTTGTAITAWAQAVNRFFERSPHPGRP